MFHLVQLVLLERETSIKVSIRRATGIEPLYIAIATATINLIVAVAIILLNLYAYVSILFLFH